MSLAIAFKGPEGIVLAADSRVTLTAQIPGSEMTVPATFDNATKLLKVSGQDYAGFVTYGVGAIGQREPRTAHSFIPELEDEFMKKDFNRLPTEEFANEVGEFFIRQWETRMPTDWTGPDMVFLVGGYDDAAAYGRVFDVLIPSRPTAQERNAGEGTFGISWGGQTELTNRLIGGYDPRLPAIVQEFLGLPVKKRKALEEHLRASLSVSIPYQFLPLQDCVDLAVFLIRTTMTLQTWQVGVRGVGGAIDVATITKTGGFEPIQQKSITGERGLRHGN